MPTFWTVHLSLKGVVYVRMIGARLDPRVADSQVCPVLCKRQSGSSQTANPAWPVLHFIRTYTLPSKELTEGVCLYLVLVHPVSWKMCYLKKKEKKREGREKRLPSSGGRSNSQLHSRKTQAEIMLNYFNSAGDFYPPKGFFSDIRSQMGAVCL